MFHNVTGVVLQVRVALLAHCYFAPMALLGQDVTAASPACSALDALLCVLLDSHFFI
jgi:hypothetical protein